MLTLLPGSLANSSGMTPASFDQVFEGFSYKDDSQLNQGPVAITRARVQSIDPKSIRDETGAPISKKGFFTSWMSNAKTFIKSK